MKLGQQAQNVGQRLCSLGGSQPILPLGSCDGMRNFDREEVGGQQHVQGSAKRITQAESKAMDEIRAAAVDVAIDAARRVIVSDLHERRGAAMLDDAIASLPQRLR